MSAIIGTNIDTCIDFLNNGQLVAIPTETVYGLAANGLDPKSVAKIFEVKNRPFFDPLILHTDTIAKVTEYVTDIPAEAHLLMNKFWPGPLTLVLKKNPVVPDLVTSGLDTVGVRIPAHPLTLRLLEKLSFPLAAPSANPFKYISPTAPMHVQKQLGDKIPYILDGGNCQIGVESTIVGFENGRPVIYRLGGIEIEVLQSVLGNVDIVSSESSHTVAPGMMKLHYSPTKKLIFDDAFKLNQFSKEHDIGILSFKEDFSKLGLNMILSKSGDLKEAANNLFAMMRELDSSNVAFLFAEKLPDEGLGRAINDRLFRASAK